MSAELDVVRHSTAGAWCRVADGTGALRLDADLVAADGALDRLVAAILAVRELGPPGVLPVSDLIDDSGQIVLLAALPVAPCLVDLVASAAPSAGAGAGLAAVAAVARDTGLTLAALHSAGLTHGSLSLDTAIVTPDGETLLNETGIEAALTGRSATSHDDIRAWATLVRMLAHAWTSGGDADQLAAVARAAEQHGIGAALAKLDGIGAGRWGDGRSALARAGSNAEPATATPPESPVATSAQATLLGRRASERLARPAGSVASSGSYQAPQDDADPVASLPSVTAQAIRFGPGVPGGPAPVSWPTPAASHVTRPRRRRQIATATVVTLCLALAVAGWLWWSRGGPLTVADVSIALAAPVEHSCDVTADVVGTIHTDGRGGMVTYQWLRNDGEPSAVLRENVAPGTREVRVHLHWSFSGRGTFPAIATLLVISPAKMSATTAFVYTCP